MRQKRRTAETASHRSFEFDHINNQIIYKRKVVRLSPHEADILRALLSNLAHPTSVDTLIHHVYGADQPQTAAISIRVAISSLRKKIFAAGMSIRPEHGVGYKIEAPHIPELNRRLSDKIGMALNLARETEEVEIAEHLEAAFAIAAIKRQRWNKPPG